MTIHDVLRPFLRYFRTRRMARFARTFRLTPATTILDVGGGLYNWTLIEHSAQVTILNVGDLSGDAGHCSPNFKFVLGDARALPYPDQSFDIVYSNSVIEHLRRAEDQRQFAREAMRVGRSLWIQTPDRFFFVEPHLVTPLVHYLPRIVQRRILRYFSIWGLIARPSQEDVDRFMSELRLLSGGEMYELFPPCDIVRERFLTLSKSLIAVRIGKPDVP